MRSARRWPTTSKTPRYWRRYEHGVATVGYSLIRIVACWMPLFREPLPLELLRHHPRWTEAIEVGMPPRRRHTIDPVGRRYRTDPLQPGETRTFGAGFLLPAAGALAVLVFVWGVARVGGEVHLRGRSAGVLLVLGLCVALVVMAMLWRKFVATSDGLELRRFLGRDLFLRWSDMGTIGGREVERRPLWDLQEGSTPGRTVIVNDVLDRDGRIVFRIGPMIHDRRGLATLIRAQLRAERGTGTR